MKFWTHEMHYGLHYARVNWYEKISHNWFYAKIQKVKQERLGKLKKVK